MSKHVRWWQFWSSQSGAVGGMIAGLVVSSPLIYATIKIAEVLAP